MRKDHKYIIQLECINKLAMAGKYDEALAIIDELLRDYYAVSELHVLKGAYIQLSSEATSYALIDALQSYKTALLFDENNINALLEIAWYEYVHEDNCKIAIDYFNRAIKLLLSQLEEAISGKIKCISETESKEDALKYFTEIVQCLNKSTPLRNVIEEL